MCSKARRQASVGELGIYRSGSDLRPKRPQGRVWTHLEQGVSTISGILRNSDDDPPNRRLTGAILLFVDQ